MRAPLLGLAILTALSAQAAAADLGPYVRRPAPSRPAGVALYPVAPAETAFGYPAAPIRYVPDPTARVAFTGGNWNGVRSPYQYPIPAGFGGYYGAPDAFGSY
jgi:hypothetical protein